jgi:sulfate transport system ATP-binding protein
VLLLDEPFGALDARVRKGLRKWLREIHDRTEITTVFVTHDQEEALELADRVVVLDHGRIEQIGTPDEIYDAPATPFVFDFIGDTSRIPVVVEAGAVAFGGERLRLDADLDRRGPATLYVRPQHWAIAATGESAVITGIRRHGTARRLDLRLFGEVAIEVDVAPEIAVAVGDEIRLTPARWRLFFDADR